MNPMSEKSFEEAVQQFFGLLASERKLALHRVDDGLFEIPSACFSLFIRRGSGHAPDIGVELVLRKDRPHCPKHKSLIEEALGLGVIMEFYGAKLEQRDLQSKEDVFIEAQRLAEAVSTFCIPFLFGQKNDWQKINDFVEGKIRRSGVLTKKYRLPKFVREEWIDEDGGDSCKRGGARK